MWYPLRGCILKNMHVGFPQQPVKFVFVEMFRRAGPPPYAPSQTGVCIDNGTIPSPGGKGDREAVDEEWRHLILWNAPKSNHTDFPIVLFNRTANKFGTYRRSSSAPVCALARNDRENGAWFLKLMTLPRRGYHISYLLSDICVRPAGYLWASSNCWMISSICS